MRVTLELQTGYSRPSRLLIELSEDQLALPPAEAASLILQPAWCALLREKQMADDELRERIGVGK